MRTFDWRIAALVVAVAAAGCQDVSDTGASFEPTDVDAPAAEDGPTGEASTPAPAGPIGPVPDTLPPAAGEDLPAFTTEASGADVTSTGEDAPILRAVRIGRHEGFDRIVFEFDSVGLPQWHVGYVDAPVVHCGSGDEVSIAGAAWLQVRFSGANAHTEAGEGTSGEARRTVGLPSVLEVVRTCDFEAEVTWVAGIPEVRAYRPRVLADPARLLVDIAHGAGD